MNQKGISTLVIAVIVVVIVAVIGVGVYLAMSGTGGNGGNGDTPTPTPVDVAGASSLQYSVEITEDGTSYTNKYMAKNIGTSDMMIRIEIQSDGGDIVYIVNSADQEAWSYMAGEWLDISTAFSNNWDMWSTTVNDYQSSLADWTDTEEWTYTDTDGNAIRIFDIAVNPSLDDSLFQHS